MSIPGGGAQREACAPGRPRSPVMIRRRRSARLPRVRISMTLAAATYDLILLLDMQAEEGVRAKIVADTREAISTKGELLRHDEWGERALAYPIDHKTTAEYHLLQFHAPKVELIAELNRTLHITDGVIRFRVNKLKPGTPAAPDMSPGAAPPPVREELEHVDAEEQALA
jgi:small subunit ribosomal protein S6